jgi:hypothetical protein
MSLEVGVALVLAVCVWLFIRVQRDLPWSDPAKMAVLFASLLGSVLACLMLLAEIYKPE